MRHYSHRPRAVASSYYAGDIAKLYNFPPADGAGQTIGIIELGGGYTDADLQAYGNARNLPPIKITPVGVDGAANNPADTSGANDEVLLDIELAYEVAPQANFRVYFSPNTDQGFLDAINKAVFDGCHIVSISWGGPENQWNPTSIQNFNNAFKNAANVGVTVLCAAGDNDSGDGEAGNNADFPGTSLYVTCVGGTNTQSSNGIILSETVWNDGNNEGTGGGYSTVFGIPNWQIRDKVRGTQRMIPDISSNADPNSGYNVYLQGQWNVIGGTSSGPPLLAGLVARLNQILGKSLGFLNPILYVANAESFVDITKGNNNSYAAAVGDDPVSGLGRIDGAKLLKNIQWAITNAEK